MTPELWLLLLLSMWIGYYIGRSSAERRRARYEMKRIWEGRANYRRRD